ncbi:MAG: hypothetical protein V3W34_19095 [Phycisphaerae bacterium]
MGRIRWIAGWSVMAAAGLGWAPGCGDAAVLFLNPSFVNQARGGLFPLVPQPETGLLLVRVVNSTDQPVSFLVTIERGEQSVDEAAGVITIVETTELFTSPGSQANEAGVLFECSDESPITRVGLGENLNQPTTDPGLFVGGFATGTPGFGVPPNINPLSRIFGDFTCGDTVIYQAIKSTNAPGGFKVQAFVLPFESQPGDTARDTFRVAADFLR